MNATRARKLAKALVGLIRKDGAVQSDVLGLVCFCPNLVVQCYAKTLVRFSQ